MKSRIKMMIYCAMFAALTAAGAFFRINFAYSSITLQFMFTALSGLMLGPWLGAASQLVYVALGLVGLPIFASGGGLGYLAVPSCGFVLGLPLCSLVTGLVSRGSRKPLRTAAASLAGLAVLYVVGLSYMALILNVYFGKGMGVWDIAMAGMIPYLPGDFLKIAVCTLVCARLPDRLFVKGGT